MLPRSSTKQATRGRKGSVLRRPKILILASISVLTGSATVLGERPVAATATPMGSATNTLARIPLPKVLDLAHAQDIARAGHPSLAAAEARIRQAQARFRIVRSSFLPTVGVRGSWTESELPDRLFESSRPPASETRASWDAAKGSWKPGDTLESYLNSPLADLTDAWADDELIPFLLGPGSKPADPVVPKADLRRLLDFLQSRPGLEEADTEAVADAFRAAYLDATVDDSPTTYWVGAQASWMVFGGFSRKFRRAAALHGEQRTMAARLDAERLLLGGVAAAYYQAQYAREELAIAQSDLDFSERMLAESQRAQQAGLRSADDVLDFSVRRNASESTRLETQRKWRLSLSALATVMALPEDGIPDTVTLAPLPPAYAGEHTPPKLDAEVAYALAHRPDLDASRYAVAIRREEIGLARSTYYPSIWLAGGYDAVRQENVNFEQDDFGWNVSLLLSFDIFRGGARPAAVSERVAAQAAAEAEVYKDELEAIGEVRDALSTLASSGEQFALQTRNLALVERFRDLAEMQYKAGTIPALKLHDAQRKLVAAQRRRAGTMIAVHAAWHALQQATARSLTLDESRPKKEMHEQP